MPKYPDWGRDPDKNAPSNLPIRVRDRYTRGTRRWSFYKSRRREKKEQFYGDRFYTVAVASSGGGYGYGYLGGGYSGAKTYSCSCADFSKQISRSPGTYLESDGSKRFTPRTFGAVQTVEYRDSYRRYQKALALVPRIVEQGAIGNTTYYKIFSDTRSQFDRNWTGSDAGTLPGQWCKHIYAVAIFRGDPFPVPQDRYGYGDDLGANLMSQESSWFQTGPDQSIGPWNDSSNLWSGWG